jgi:hypothetical protein
MPTTITTAVDGHDDFAAFVGVSPEVLQDALHLRTHHLNLLLNVIGVVQMRAAAPRRKQDKPARDETAEIHVVWAKAITGKGREATVDRMLELSGLRLGPHNPVKVDYVQGAFNVTLAAAFAYPRVFVRIPLPLPVGDKALLRAWMRLWVALHHGRLQPIELEKPLEDDQIAQFNQQLRKLDKWRLGRHRIIVPRRVEQTVADGVHYLAFTMPKEDGQ